MLDQALTTSTVLRHHFRKPLLAGMYGKGNIGIEPGKDYLYSIAQLRADDSTWFPDDEVTFASLEAVAGQPRVQIAITSS